MRRFFVVLSWAVTMAAGQPITIAPVLEFVSPRPGEVVSDRLEVRLRVVAVDQPIHLLVTDAANPDMYQYVGHLAPMGGRAGTMTALVDMSALSAAATIRLEAMASDRLTASIGESIRARALPASVPVGRVDVRHAGAILTPSSGSRMGIVDTVRAVGFLPGTYLTAVIRPAGENAYWVQNAALPVRPAAPTSIRVQLGGDGLFELYLGVTYDRELFVGRVRFDRLPDVDRDGRSVYWIGPVEVNHP